MSKTEPRISELLGPLVTFVHEEVVLSPQCNNLCSPAALNIINYRTLFMSGCWVLRMDQVLDQCVGGFEVDQDVY